MCQRFKALAILQAQQHQRADAGLQKARLDGERRTVAGRPVGRTDENIGGRGGERASEGGGIGDEMRFGTCGAGGTRKTRSQQRTVVEDQHAHAFERGEQATPAACSATFSGR